MDTVNHEIHPVFNEQSSILILGTFPSVKSREGNFFYHHPQNRFWKVLAAVFGREVPDTVEKKKKFLLENHIAVWDVIATCDIAGSSDSSIRNVIPNDLNVILKKAEIKEIYANGATAAKLYDKYCKSILKKEVVRLPSTSPANAAFSLEELIEEWDVIKKY